MKKCIYCLQEGSENDFQKEEHIISQFLGTFREPELTFKGDIVCDRCNNKLSSMEGAFAEDTIIGIQLAMVGLRCKKTVRVLGKRVKMTITSDGDLGVFQNNFPYITKEGIKPRPCFLIRNGRGAMQVLWIDEFVNYKKGGSEYRKIKKWLQSVKITERYIFANEEFPIEKIMEIVTELGIPYKEVSREAFADKDRGSKFTVEITGEFDDELRRFPCKVAFNYFAYCAEKSGMKDMLYRSEFNEIRDFILKEERKDGKLPIRLVRVPTLDDEKNTSDRRPYHQVSFLHNTSTNMIVAKVSLLGMLDFEVDLGQYNMRINPAEFGCGHIFDPFEERWADLYPSSIPILRARKFGLFNRKK